MSNLTPQAKEILQETLADLYTLDKQYDKALHVMLELRRGDVFNLITKHDLFHTIQVCWWFVFFLKKKKKLFNLLLFLFFFFCSVFPSSFFSSRTRLGY